MKKRVMSYLVVSSFGLFASVHLHAQVASNTGLNLKDAANKTDHAVKKSAKKSGNKTGELGKTKIVDKTYDEKQGPNGETIFINNNSIYYWIDKNGHKRYVAESQLRDK